MKKNVCVNVVLFAGIMLAIIFSNFSSFTGEYRNLEQGVLRMHILANSDSTADQCLKLRVRNSLLEHSDEIFGTSQNIDEAEESVSKKLTLIQEIAQQTVNENGFSYSVKCELVNMKFDARTYEDITMPAGDYDAIRVTIGKAEGHNWWCVMYPPLCVPMAEDTKDEKQDTSKTEECFTETQLDMMKNPQHYKVRFKCVEVYDDIKSYLKNKL